MPLLVAIAGGSGSGKTWLAKKLQAALGPDAMRLSLDDFYRDRSRLSPARRERLNFDHPRAIDWPAVERALRDLFAGRPARLPSYDFKTHCRLPHERVLTPTPVVLVDGLWLLHRRALRRLFALRIFIDCPARTRLRRRLARDLRSRGRTAAAVRRQFRDTVDPMHAGFVAPQERRADVVLPADFGEREVRDLAALLMPHAKRKVADAAPRHPARVQRAKRNPDSAHNRPNACAAARGADGAARHPPPLRSSRPLREAQPAKAFPYDLKSITPDETSG